MDRILNVIIFLLVVGSVGGMFRKDGKWAWKNGSPFLCYFTVLSNSFCGIAALLLALFPSSQAIWLAKYTGTVGLTVTMLTVFLFLKNSCGLAELLKGEQLYMHLITPLLAIISFVVFERRGLEFLPSLLGVLAVSVYGTVYCVQVVFRKKWTDFYGFNRGGKWYVALPVMLGATFILCMVYMMIA